MGKKLYMLQEKEPHTLNPSQFLALSSITQPEFLILLCEFSDLWESWSQRYTLKGAPRKHPQFREHGGCSLTGSCNKLFFILHFLKTNPLQTDFGANYDLCQGKVSQWVKVLLPILKRALDRLKLLPGRNATQLFAVLLTLGRLVVFIDATERKVPRSTDYEVQKDFYSGKKGCHTVKNNLLTDLDNRILYLSPTYEGKTHDKKMADEAGFYFPDGTAMFEDLGYQGLKVENCLAIIPHKKPRGGKLSPAHKELNKLISSIRVKVEHAIAGVKRIRIVKEKIRLRGDEVRDLVMEIACGLHNLRVENRADLGQVKIS